MVQKKYLVTGAAGFIGDRMARALGLQGHQVIWVDALEHFENRTAEHPLLPDTQMVARQDLASWLARPENRIDGVFHLGACSSTTETNVEYLRKTNVEYSQMIWNFCSDQQIPLIYASSAATYGEGKNGYDDDESQMYKLHPLNPYGESKLIFDLWALEQEKKGYHPPSWCGFKFFNVYGYGERHKGKMSSVVIQAFDQIKKTGSMKLFKSHRDGIADGEQKRDFIYVNDVVDVMSFAMEKPIPRGIYNLGTGHARSFLDLAHAVFHALAIPPRIDFIDTPIAIRDRYQYFTEAKMEKLRTQGYQTSFTSLEDGVLNYIRQLG